MNDKIRICIADDNIDFVTTLAKYLKSNDRIEIVKTCSNGKEVLQLLNEEHIDVLLMDIIMPYIDGIGVLEELAESDKDDIPKIIIISAISYDSCVFNILNNGISYYMVKPIKLDILLNRIIEVYESDLNIQEQKIEKAISQKLREYAIYPNLVGYKYIKESIEILIQRPMYANNFRENVYSIIAKENNMQEFQIEKAINNAIHTSWNKDREKLVETFKCKIYRRKAPSARVFISMMAEDIANMDYEAREG